MPFNSSFLPRWCPCVLFTQLQEKESRVRGKHHWVPRYMIYQLWWNWARFTGSIKIVVACFFWFFWKCQNLATQKYQKSIALHGLFMFSPHRLQRLDLRRHRSQGRRHLRRRLGPLRQLRQHPRRHQGRRGTWAKGHGQQNHLRMTWKFIDKSTWLIYNYIIDENQYQYQSMQHCQTWPVFRCFKEKWMHWCTSAETVCWILPVSCVVKC